MGPVLFDDHLMLLSLLGVVTIYKCHYANHALRGFYRGFYIVFADARGAIISDCFK